MAHNDPDNLTIESGEAVLVCDQCGQVFRRALKAAQVALARNSCGEVFCSRVCAAKANNAARPAPRTRTPRHTCHIRPGAQVCPLVAAPPRHSDDLRRQGFVPQTEEELDLCVEYVVASAACAKNAPPEDETENPWQLEQHIAWERAEAALTVVSRLLDRAVSRRDHPHDEQSTGVGAGPL